MWIAKYFYLIPLFKKFSNSKGLGKLEGFFIMKLELYYVTFLHFIKE